MALYGPTLASWPYPGLMALPGTWHRVPGTWYRVPGTGYWTLVPGPCIWDSVYRVYMALDPVYRVYMALDPVYGVLDPVSGTLYLGSRTLYSGPQVRDPLMALL